MPVSAHYSWPVKHPRWVMCVQYGVVVAALAALLYCLPLLYVVVIVLFLALLQQRGRCHRRVVSAGTVCYAGLGRWAIDVTNRLQYQDLCLVRIWFAPGWVTMQFSNSTTPEPKDTMLQVTIWKATVTPSAWRGLRVHMANCVAKPEPMVVRVAQ